MGTPPRSPVAAAGVVLAAAALGLLAAGCELATGPAHFRDDLGGRFDGTFTLEWEPVGFGRGGWVDGPGTIRVRRHFGSGFGGEWSWRVDGRRLRGRLERGRAGFGRDLSFRLETRFGRDLLEEVTGCRFVRGDRRFHARADRHRLRAEREARLRCHDAFSGFREDVWARLSFHGRR